MGFWLVPDTQMASVVIVVLLDLLLGIADHRRLLPKQAHYLFLTSPARATQDGTMYSVLRDGAVTSRMACATLCEVTAPAVTSRGPLYEV